ncbi:hypothetical protein AX14_010128 [Amanita brunnescens Koide BX004]|nr:hypothetical protein AX14_002596 [Amanita brunnescens Koide BX004]KAF8721893.1 hypothetical protein AX14_010128 [Amanita brunnescens Koide BX004]
MKFDKSTGDLRLATAVKDILLPVPIQVKRLRLCLTYEQFMALSTLSETALSGVSEFELDLTFPDNDVDVNMNDPHPLITRLRSLSFHFCGEAEPEAWISPFLPSLPWSQLRSLNFAGTPVEDLHLILDILRQISMLEALSLRISNCIGVSEQLAMPSLRNFAISLNWEVNDRTEIDTILHSFVCPSLTELSLVTHGGSWTCETFKILKQQYNMQELRIAKIFGYFKLPVSSFLQEAPMLRSFSLGRRAIMDDEAVIGISSGALGRFLRRLELFIPCDVGEVLSIVEARKKTVEESIKNGCSWRDEMTTLKDVGLPGDWKGKYKDRVMALKEAGITIEGHVIV